MSDWLHDLPVTGMAVVVFGVIYLATGAIYAGVIGLATGERGRAFKGVTAGMLSPLGILFALFVVFTASQVWSDNDRANAAVNREASALRAVLVLAGVFPGQHEATLRSLVRRHIEDAASREWPMMAERTATLSVTSPRLIEALRATLAIVPGNQGQQTAQAEIVTDLEAALAGRRERILISQSQVGPVKWFCLFAQAFGLLLVVALVHGDNRLTVAIALGIMATGVATSVLLIVAYDRPFIGQLAVGPGPLLQVMAAAADTP
jgi:Protein of unknown function (DUF4239)